MATQAQGVRVASWLLISIALALAAGCSDDAEPAIDAAAADAPTDAPMVDARADAPPVDAPVDAPPVDAPIDGIPIDADPSACTINGIYTTVFSDTTLFFSFTAGSGAWAAALTEAELTTAPLVRGTFTFAGVAFTIVETPPSPCPGDQIGQYTVAFSPTCDFTLTLVTDACTERGDALGGATFTPQ